MNSVAKNIILNTDIEMPVIGLGTYKSGPGEVGSAVEYAISKAKYRHIDCAARYHNEKEIGKALHTVLESKTLKRDDIFVTSKLWNTEHHPKNVEWSCKNTLRDLKLDYLNLYLVHWNIASVSKNKSSLDLQERLEGEFDSDGTLILDDVPINETWGAMEDLVKLGLVKTIGVANFTTNMLTDLTGYAKIQPAVNQIELHPYLQEQKLVKFCKDKNIAVTGYSPLGRIGIAKEKGLPLIIEEEIITSIAKNHNKTPAQIILRWGIQRGIVVIPKSVNKKRIQENIDIFDFELTNDEMEKIANLERNFRFMEPNRWWKLPYFR